MHFSGGFWPDGLLAGPEMARNDKKMQEIARIHKQCQGIAKHAKEPILSAFSAPRRPSSAGRSTEMASCWSEGGAFSPRKLSGTGSVKERGKGLRRTGVRRAAAAAPGPGRGGRVLAKGMCWVEPVLNGALRSSGFPLDQCTFLADSGRTAC